MRDRPPSVNAPGPPPARSVRPRLTLGSGSGESPAMLIATARLTRLRRLVCSTVGIALLVAAGALAAGASAESATARAKKKKSTRAVRHKRARRWVDPRVSAIRQVPTAMLWARDRDDGRDSVHVDIEGTVTGVYNHSVLRFALPVERRGELKHFLDTYGQIADSTVDAPHFRLVVHGRGTGGATRAERRAATSWLVSTAATAVPDTVEGPFNPLMFIWVNGGGAESGVCDTVAITYAGQVSVFSCRKGFRPSNSWLAANDLANIYQWVDSCQTFTSIRSDGDLHSSTYTRTSLTLRGFGIQMPSDSLKNSLHAWAQLLATRARLAR